MWSKVRKFGLSHCDLPTMIWNVSVFLRVLALNIDSRYTKRIPVLFYVLLVVTMSGYIYVYVISMIWFVFWKSRETGDVIAAMIVFSLGVASAIGVVKLFFMFIYNETVKVIVKDYLQCDAAVEPGCRFAINISKTLRWVKKRAMLFWITIIGNGVIYTLKPIITPGRHIMEDQFVYVGLEPMLDTPNYQIAFAVTLCGVFQTCFTASNMTAFFITIAGYTEAQMLALGEELNCLWNDANINYDKELKYTTLRSKEDLLNEYIKDKLEFIVQCHNTNLKLLKKVESVFQGVIAAEFLFLIVSLIAELLGGLENTYLEIPFAIMMVTMDCWTGQKLMDANIVFNNAVYNCNWENFDTSNKKTVLLMLLISQKEMKLSAGGITTLNFNSLMMVIRAIYSAYTTLRSTM